MEIDKNKEYYTLSSPNVPLKITRSTVFGNTELYYVNNEWHNASSLSLTPIDKQDLNIYKIQEGSKFKFSLWGSNKSRVFVNGTIIKVESSDELVDMLITIKLDEGGLLIQTYSEFIKSYPEKINSVIVNTKPIAPKGLVLDEVKPIIKTDGVLIPSLYVNDTNNQIVTFKHIGLVGKTGFNNNKLFIKLKRSFETNSDNYIVYDKRYNNYYYFELAANNKLDFIGCKLNHKRKMFPQELIGLNVFSVSKEHYYSLVGNKQITQINEQTLKPIEDVFEKPIGKGIVEKDSNNFIYIKLTLPFDLKYKYFYNDKPLPFISYDTETKLVKLSNDDNVLIQKYVDIF